MTEELKEGATSETAEDAISRCRGAVLIEAHSGYGVGGFLVKITKHEARNLVGAAPDGKKPVVHWAGETLVLTPPPAP